MKHRLEILTNLAVIVVVCVFMLSDSGPIGHFWRQRQERQALVDRLTHHWPRLKEKGGVLGNRTEASVVVFTDYQCPACRETEGVLEGLVNDGVVPGVIYRNYPLAHIHPRAREAALASICADRLGTFKELHSYLLHTEAWYEWNDWETVAKDAGVADAEALAVCMLSSETQARLAEDITLGRALGVHGTPTFVTATRVSLGAEGLALLQDSKENRRE